MASEFQHHVASTYVAEQFNALLSDEAPKIDWFAAESTATFSSFGAFMTVAGDEVSRYSRAVADTIGDSNVMIAELAVVPSVANQIVVSVSGSFLSSHAETTFSLVTILGQSDSDSSYFVHSEIMSITGKTEVVNQVQADGQAEDQCVVEEPVTPPSPPATPQVRVEDPKPKSEPVVVATGWAAVAAAKRDQPLAEAKKEVRPAAKPTQPPAVAPKEPEPVRAKEKKAECTVSVRVSTTVSDEEVVKALPVKLQSSIVSVRNKSSDATIRRVWIEFSVANAVSVINESTLIIGGKPVVAETPRKKN